MKEAFHYFIAADTIAMPPFKWGMTVIFTGFLLVSLYLTWKQGLKDIDILSILLILVILFRSTYPLFLHDETLDQALRLLFFLFPLSTALLTHYLFTKYRQLRVEQLVIGLIAVLFTIVNLTMGGALNPGSPHWWADIYPLKLLNQAWLVLAITYSILALGRLPKEKKPYVAFIKAINLALVIYLFGHFLLTLSTTMDMYWIYRYHGFVAELMLVYAYASLLWKLYNKPDDEPIVVFDRQGIDIFDVMAKIPADKLIHFLEVNHPGSIPEKVQKLSPRQQLQAILMIHKVSIRESAEYSYVTPQAVKVYRSRIRKKLG